MTPDRTSPVPAVASDGVPAVANRTRPDGSATAVVGPLRRATAPEAAARSAGGGDPVGPGGLADQPGVLAVVGGEHHRRPGRQRRVDAGRGRGGRRRRPPPAPATRRPGVAPRSAVPSARPSPGPTTTAWHRSGRLEGGVGPPRPPARSMPTASPAGSVGRVAAGHPEPDHAGARPGRRHGPTGRRPRSCPATRPPPARRPPTCCPPGSRGGTRAPTSPSSTTAIGRTRRSAGRCRPPGPRRPGAAPSPWTRPGLRATKVTVAVAGSTEPVARAGVALHPRGDVDGQDRDAGGHPRGVVGAAEAGAEGGVDHQVDRRPVVADGVDRTGGHHGDPHARAGPAAGRPPARRPRCCPCRR